MTEAEQLKGAIIAEIKRRKLKPTTEYDAVRVGEARVLLREPRYGRKGSVVVRGGYDCGVPARSFPWNGGSQLAASMAKAPKIVDALVELISRLNTIETSESTRDAELKAIADRAVVALRRRKIPAHAGEPLGGKLGERRVDVFLGAKDEDTLAKGYSGICVQAESGSVQIAARIDVHVEPEQVPDVVIKIRDFLASLSSRA